MNSNMEKNKGSNEGMSTLTLTGKRKLIEDVINENEKSPKILKLDETKLESSTANCNVKSTDLTQPNKTNLAPSTDSSKIMGISKRNTSNSSHSKKSGKTGKFLNVLRSERPLISMSMYTKYDLHGIVPEDVVAVFRSQKKQKFRQMKRESKEKDPSNTDTRLVR